MPTMKKTYLPRLTNEDIGELLVVAGKFRPKSERLAGWINALAEHEIRRREAEKTGDPLEVEMPTTDCTRWSDGELLDAVWTSFAAHQILAHNERVGALLAEFHEHLLLWTRARFRGDSEPDVLAHNDGASTE